MTKSDQLPNCSTCAVIPQFNVPPLSALAHDNSRTTFEVQYRGVDSPNDVNVTFNEAVTVTAGMTLNLSISDLMAYSAYNVSVRATNQYGVGGFSEEATVRTEEGGEYVPIHSIFSTRSCRVLIVMNCASLM